uniref:Uncharacterized protein n=1 Tax=Panagrolaimus sp. ES5 TaxID=591445 RepID=A0AC34FPJ7_9BILA
MEIVLDSSSEAERSPKPKKSKKVVSDKTDDDNSVFEDAKNSPKLNNHKKKTPSKSAENSMEIVLDDDSDEHKKKSSTTSNQNLEEIILGNDSDVEKSSKPKTSKKAKKNVEGTSSMLKDDSVPNKQKAKAKPENLNTLEKAFAKSNPEKVSKPKKSKGDNNKNATAREDSDVETEQKPKKSHKKKVPANVNENSVGDLSDKTDGGTTSKLQKPKKLKPSPLLNASPPKSSPTKKNPATPNSAKKSTQQSIFGFCTLQSPAVSTGNDKANARECYEDALKALKKGQHFAFKQAINAAQKLSESSIELIESECFKFAETVPKPKKSHKKKVPANVNENSVGDLSDKTDGGTTSKLQKPKKLKPSPLLNASPPKSSPTKKNPATPNSAKKSTQQSIFGFCTLQSPAVSTGNDKAKARECYEDALKALKKGQHFAFKQAINAAQKLSESSIELIESECFKFAVLKFRRNNFDDDENENYQKYERMLSQFSKNICEDTSILNSKAFPDLKLAMKNNPHSNLFGNCLAISQFFVSFPTYLDTSLKFSAEELLNAVTSGAEGYYKLTGEILAEFLHAFSTYEWFKGFKFFSAHIQDVTWNSNSASEILKLFLLRDISPLTREVKHSVDGKLHDIIKGNKSELEKKKLEADKKRRDTKTLVPILDEELTKAFANKEFHELLPKQQILIFEHLIDLFMTDYFFTRQFEPEECKVIAREKIDEMKKELQEMIVKNQTMKRSEKRKEQEEKKPDQQYVKKKQNLEKKILIAERTFTLNQLNAALKPLPLTLGYDRFHRRYYIFQNSPNSGIYIEEFCQISLDESTEFEDDPIASELERFTVESARIPMKR